ncbi:hypothetical protein V7S43_019093 [Phytophthora oleae]|uniref:Uncharacterized protein n=1 Tax=Phytophthora oleae TaxID=2107226 RepID=A0ABD3EYF3_9STRA
MSRSTSRGWCEEMPGSQSLQVACTTAEASARTCIVKKVVQPCSRSAAPPLPARGSSQPQHLQRASASLLVESYWRNRSSNAPSFYRLQQLAPLRTGAAHAIQTLSALYYCKS